MLFFYPSENFRFAEDRSCYQNEINKLTMEGKYLIADYYNKTYFLNQTKKIVLANSFAELKVKIRYVQLSAYQQVGFVFSDGPDSHTSPILFEKATNGLDYLYIADGIQLSADLARFLKDFCDENSITLCITIFQRQMDVASCRSEALTYIKNALQQPSIYDHVTILKPQVIQDESILKVLKTYHDFKDWDWYIFLESPDMLKTSQNSKIIHFDTERTLYSTKQNLSYTKKMESYRKPVDYTHCENNSLTKTFFERTYLREKTISHVKKIKALQAAYPESKLQEILTGLKNQL